MLKLRVREYTPDGVRGRVLPTLAGTISYTQQFNGSPQLKFALSTRAAGRMPDDGFAVGVEYQAEAGGRFQPLPEHDRFIMTTDDGDDADQSKTISYTGELYTTFYLAHTYVHWAANAKNGSRSVSGALGGTLRYFLLESWARGWGQNFTIDFDGAKDSAGVAWSLDDAVRLDWRLLTPLTQVVSSYCDGGLAEWTTQGMKLRAFRPGTLGADRTELVLGGPRMERIPVKTDVSGIATNFTIVPEKASYWLYLTNPGAPSKWGRLEATMTLSGVESHAEATKLAQPALAAARASKREEAFEWTPEGEDLVPWRDFRVGDSVTARARGGSRVRRVIGLVVREQGEATTVRTIVGEKIGTTQAKILARVGAGSVGGTIGGTGNSFPGSIGPSPLAPDRPNGLFVKSNTASWREDYSAESAVELEWQPVTAAVDGSEADVVEYEVWARLPHERLSYVTTITATAEPNVTITVWAPGVGRLVAVRAKSAEGVYGDWSLEVPVTPVTPASVVPKPPTGLRLISNTGAFTAAGPIASVLLGWDAVTKSTDDVDIAVTEYELWTAAPVMRIPATTGLVSVPSGFTEDYRVRARTGAGVWSDLSDVCTVTGATPDVGPSAPTVPTLATGYGDVVARWDGTYVGEPAAGAHSAWVEARIAAKLEPSVPATAWQRQGPAITGAGSALIRLGEVGDTLDVRIVAYDQLGRATGTSGVASIVIATIDGAALTVGSIEVDHLSPNVGDNLNLTANGSIILIAGQQDALAESLAGVTEDVSQIDEKASNAGSAAAAAAAAAAIADGKALVAQQQAQQASDGLAVQQSVFVVTPTGAEVRSKDASDITRLEPGEISMLQGGVKLFRVKDSQVIANELVANRAQLANHVIEKSGTRTVIRML